MNHLLKIFFISVILSTGVLQSQDSSKTGSDSLIIYDRHPQDTPPGAGFYIRSADGKSFLRVYGSIKLNGGYDIGGLKTRQTFSTFDIPTDEIDKEGRFFMSPYQSRIGFEANIMTEFGLVKTKMESDFLGSGSTFRIRHAFAVYKRVLLGQTWSVFADPSSIPNTVDLDGPNSSVSERTIQLRFQPPQAKYNWAAAIEAPDPDISTPDSTQLEPVFQSFPDVTGRLRFEPYWGHIQLSGIFRSITVRNIDNSLRILAGYGGLFSGSFHFNKQYHLNYQLLAGKGISRYIRGLKGKGQDIVFDEQAKTNNLLFCYGGFISGNHRWTDRISTDLTIGLLRIINEDFQPPAAFKISYYASLNLFIKILENSQFGIEYSYGKRINKNGNRGYANRVSFIGFMDF